MTSEPARAPNTIEESPGLSPPAETTHGASPASAAGRWWIVLAALMWSSSGLFAKSPVFEAWPADERGILLAFWRALFAGLLLVPFVRGARWDVRLVPLSLTFATMNVSYLSAMTLTTAANAIWLQSTAPWWVCLIGFAQGGTSYACCVLRVTCYAERRRFAAS